MAKILIIEDDPLVSRMYQRVFEFEKFEVSLANNGAEGLEFLHKDKPNLIMLDIMMPQMNGIEVLTKIKENPETANIPVVVLTNLSGTVDAEKALSLGAVKFIIKSEHKPSKIVKLVREILDASTRNEIPTASTKE